jgi:N-acyl-D-aspartate/D-glutamate deacylase
VREGRIVAVGRLSEGAAETIEAEGLVVAPGIIDVHTHYDPQLTFEPLATSSIWHGVTTVVTGNCGFTLAPCRPADRDYMTRMFANVEGMSRTVLEAGLPWTWESFPEFLETLDRRLGVNAMVFAGHSALRRYVLGEAANERPASEAEVVRMADLLRAAMAAGAAGLTTSRAPTHVDGDDRPVPSRGGTRAEMVALAGVLAEFNAGAIELVPETLFEGISDDERGWLVDLALASGRPVMVMGFGARRTDDAGLARDERFLAEAAARGARLFMQIQNQPSDRPFNFGAGPTLDTLPGAALDQLPTWQMVMRLPEAERLERLGDAATRERLRHEVDNPDFDPGRGRMMPAPRWGNIFVSRVARPENARHEGRRVVEIAAEEGRHVADVLLDLVCAEALGTEFFYGTRNPAGEERIGRALCSPYAVVGTSDGGAHLEREDGADWSTYFLAYWVREKGLMTLEEAIRRLTFVPAALMGLPERGLLRAGYAADLFLFDPEAIRPVSKRQVDDFPGGGRRYVTEPAGIRRVIVNGRVVVSDSRHSGAYPGRVLRPGRGT